MAIRDGMQEVKCERLSQEALEATRRTRALQVPRAWLARMVYMVATWLDAGSLEQKIAVCFVL